jgi:16S rRNA (adenine1518-N6/adenine1519-N6)-dimethyltransferase
MMNVRRLLKEFDIQPKKSLSQNFLVDQRALERIVEAAELGPEDIVLEIGPGLGTLTRLLAAAAGRVVAVELDQRLVEVLKQTAAAKADLPNVEIIHGNILELNPADLLEQQRDSFQYKVVANLPYYITSAILRHLLTAEVRPSLMVVTVQLEVARRITAEPGDMSLLAVSVQFYGRPRIVARIKASAFYPSPRVDSAVIRIDLDGHPIVEVDDADSFFEVVRAGFAQRRKQLRNALAAELALPASEAAQALIRAGVNPRRRAQTLSVEEWVKVWKEMQAQLRCQALLKEPSCPMPKERKALLL